jgi:hypothetical protein
MKAECSTCTYYRTRVGGPDAGKCHRYPDPTPKSRDHWCGEYAPARKVSRGARPE